MYEAHHYTGGDGSSVTEAVKILLKTTDEGVKAEHAYLAHHLGDYEVLGQKLVEEGGRPFDVLHVQVDGEREIDVFFDISEFYGKGSDDWLTDFLDS